MAVSRTLSGTAARLAARALLPALALLAAAAVGAHAQDTTAVRPAGTVRVADASRAESDTTRLGTARGLVTREEVWTARMRAWGIDNPDPAPRRPTSRADSLAWERARGAAARATGRRVVISLFDRRLWLIQGKDTLLSAPAAVGMGVVKVHGQEWDHSTPRGRRVVRAKETEPMWIPPDWHYLQAAARHRRPHAHLRPGRGVTLQDGRRLVVRDSVIVLVSADGGEETVGSERSLVFDDTQFIPPVGPVNRAIPDVLGRFKLDLGDGYLIHGTTESISIGFPSTHGCIRLDDADLAALFEATPPGTPVFIY